MKYSFVLVLALAMIGSSFSAYAAEKNLESAGEPNRTEVGSSRPSSVSVELLGRGGLYSFDVDHEITSSIAIGAGFSYWTVSAILSTPISVVLVPLYADFYFMSGAHRLFFSPGFDLVLGSTQGTSLVGAGAIFVFGGGYEYRSQSGFLFRAAPYVLAGSGGAAITGGISAGYAF